MKQLDERAWLDDKGQLWTLQPGKYDSFAPLGALPADVLVSSGAYFDSVPTYGSFLSNWWENNPLQFASEATASDVAGRAEKILGSKFRVWQYDEVVNTGPFRWDKKRMIGVQPVSDEPSGVWFGFCAGLEASAFARNPANYEQELQDRVTK